MASRHSARYSAHRQSKGQAALAQTAVAAEMAFLSLRGKQGAENHRKVPVFLGNWIDGFLWVSS